MVKIVDGTSALFQRIVAAETGYYGPLTAKRDETGREFP